MKPNTPAGPPSHQNFNQLHQTSNSQAHQLQNGAFFKNQNQARSHIVTRPAEQPEIRLESQVTVEGSHRAFGIKSHQQRVQDFSLQPLKGKCDQSVASVNVDDSVRISDGGQVSNYLDRQMLYTPDNQSARFRRGAEESSMGGENIQDSAMDYQLQLPSAFRGAAKILDNHQLSGCVAGGSDLNNNAHGSEQKDKQTSIKKLLDQQRSLLNKCTSILIQIDDGLKKSEDGLVSHGKTYSSSIKQVQQAEFQLETLLVKYMRMKESTLGELYNLTQATQSTSRPLFAPKPHDKKAPDVPTRYTQEQQILVLGLLKMRVCTAEHFKVLFADQKQQLASTDAIESPDAASLADFIDSKKEVPFVGDFEDNQKMTKLAPSFRSLQELHNQIKDAKVRMQQAEASKRANYFKKAADSKRIGQLRSDKRELVNLINQIQLSLSEVEERKLEMMRKPQLHLVDKSQSTVNDENLLVDDYLVGKVSYTEKKAQEALNKLHLVKTSLLNCSTKNQQDSSGLLLSKHEKQTLISRNQIETDFMKKKLHFVSEFNNDFSFKQALSGLASTVLNPPVHFRNHTANVQGTSPAQPTLNSQRKSLSKLQELISGSRENLHSERAQLHTVSRSIDLQNRNASNSPRRVGLSARNQEGTNYKKLTPHITGGRVDHSPLGQPQFKQTMTDRSGAGSSTKNVNPQLREVSPNSARHHSQHAQYQTNQQPAGDLTVSILQHQGTFQKMGSIVESSIGGHALINVGVLGEDSASIQNRLQPGNGSLSIQNHTGQLVSSPMHHQAKADKKNLLLRQLSVDRIDLENDNDDKMEPQFESDGGISRVMQRSNNATASAILKNKSLDSQEAKLGIEGGRNLMIYQGLVDHAEMRKAVGNSAVVQRNNMYSQFPNMQKLSSAKQKPASSDLRMQDGVLGRSEGVQQKEVNQSVADSMNDSSIQLRPEMLVDYQLSSRRQTNKLQEKQSDEPADQSGDEARQDEMDIEELKTSDIALFDPSKQAAQRRISSRKNSVDQNAKGKFGQSQPAQSLQVDRELRKLGSCATDRDDILSGGTHNSYDNGSRIHFEPVLDQNALTKKASVITDGRPPRQSQRTNRESAEDSSNNLSNNSMSSKRHKGVRKQPRALRNAGSPKHQQRTTCLSEKDREERLINSEKKQTSMESPGIGANSAGGTQVQVKTKPASHGCFSCFCLPNKSTAASAKNNFRPINASREAQSGGAVSDDFQIERKDRN